MFSLIREFYAQEPTWYQPSGMKVPLSVPSYSSEEVIEALDSLLEGRVTMGKNVQAFENRFASYIGTRHAVMVNSGSSANLLAMSLLSNPKIRGRLRPGDEVITPALTWSTTVFPIIGMGLIPVFVDVNLDGFVANPAVIESAITRKTRALFLVHLLGNPSEMKSIVEIAEDHGLFLIEDACEALGAEENGIKIGSFGDVSTFSFYFSHHITTIEGGMLVSDNEDIAELAKIMRAHGWIRDVADRQEIAQAYNEIDPRFLFVNLGYNMRPTEIQGAFGGHQLDKLRNFIQARRENASFWNSRLKTYSEYFMVSKERPNAKHVWFGYPITVRPDAPFDKSTLMAFLEGRGIETRPLMSGNMTRHPVMKLFDYRTSGELLNTDAIDRSSFLIGNHHGIGRDEREYVMSAITDFIDQKHEIDS